MSKPARGGRVSKPFIIVTADQILDCVDIAQRTCDAQQAADYLNAILNEQGTVLRELKAPMGTWVNGEPEDAISEALMLAPRELTP